MILIRHEKPEDVVPIHHVNEQAFGRPQEAKLVDKLRAHQKATFSLVAVVEEQIVGHILFSPVTIESGNQVYGAIGLAPLAVLPERQGQGIGSQLVTAGLAACRQAGHDCVVVLGHPEYYPRFGFVPASRYGITSEYDVPAAAFMVIELRAGVLQGRGGIARYQPEFTT